MLSVSEATLIVTVRSHVQSLQGASHNRINANNKVLFCHPSSPSAPKDDKTGRVSWGRGYRQPAQQTNELGQTETCTYDAAGNTATYTDRNGLQTIYSYNNRNRLQSKTAGGASIAYTYLNNGCPATITDSRGPSSFEYYDNDLLKKETLPDNKTVQYEYNHNGSRTKLTDPFNLAVNYQYDNLNRLDAVTVDGKTFNYSYYDDGMLQSITYPLLSSGLTLSEEFTYDNGNRLTTVTNKKGTQVISQFTYTHDNQGNILSVTSASQTTSYQYDDLNRLREISRPNQDNTSYQYDNRGNRKQSSGIDLGITRLTPCQLDYNVWNELSDFTKGSSSYDYAYDADGLRIRKSGPATDIRYYYDDNARVIAESTESGQLTAQIIWGNQALARKVGSNYYYYIYNGHGDVVQIVNEAGTEVNSYTYDEWGNITSQTEGITNELKYCGEPFDSETGFYYLRARYYDPTVGRFVSQDSNEGDITNPLSLNLYTYCLNNPIKYVDPSGNIVETVLDVGSAIYSGY
jgi:RHS repeat-associated protein